jgi:hypothetical protein
MRERIKNLQRRVLELELASVDNFTKRSYLNAFNRMDIDTEEGFDKYVEDVKCELDLSDGVSGKQTQGQIKEVAKEVINVLGF